MQEAMCSGTKVAAKDLEEGKRYKVIPDSKPEWKIMLSSAAFRLQGELETKTIHTSGRYNGLVSLKFKGDYQPGEPTVPVDTLFCLTDGLEGGRRRRAAPKTRKHRKSRK